MTQGYRFVLVPVADDTPPKLTGSIMVWNDPQRHASHSAITIAPAPVATTFEDGGYPLPKTRPKGKGAQGRAWDLCKRVWGDVVPNVGSWSELAKVLNDARLPGEKRSVVPTTLRRMLGRTK